MLLDTENTSRGQVRESEAVQIERVGVPLIADDWLPSAG
jgi:hypothetical protein